MIRGLQKTTLIDYPGKVACTVFLGGCNFRCGYCYNCDLVLGTGDLPHITLDDFFSFLQERNSFLDGVCITGGEPTLFPDLERLCILIKSLGLLVKLDTNGSNPRRLARLFERKLVDYVAMDVKAGPDNYSVISGVSINLLRIQESRTLIMNSGVAYEFRSTVVPDVFTHDEVHRIGQFVRGARQFYLQQFFSGSPTLDSRYVTMDPLPSLHLQQFKVILEQYVDSVGIRL